VNTPAAKMKKVLPLPSKQTNPIRNIDIVLVQPKIADNIGLCARVLKNTSFFSLSLVNLHLNEKSFQVAKCACDVLQNAKIYKNLKRRNRFVTVYLRHDAKEKRI
jgi:tRNA C32,U32 (ribose-2'-O)-methylase TrmJ